MKTLRNLFLILLSISAYKAFAGTDYRVEAENRLAQLLTIDTNTATNNPTPNCLARYQNLYKDSVLNVALAFGYWDNSPDEYVFDQWIANGLRFALIAPCTQGRLVCGFTRTGDMFTKTVTGPDGKKNTFKISLTQGSLTVRNDDNTTKFRAQQYAKCEEATNKFFREVSRGSEVVMYIGHARNGGGPDLCPPVREENKHVNYPWYEKNRPGFNRLLSSMAEAKAAGHPNQVVGLYSCYSKKHFYRELNALNPDAGYLLTSNEITSTDALASVVTTLDALIGQKCSGLTRGIRLSPVMNMNGMFVK